MSVESSSSAIGKALTLDATVTNLMRATLSWVSVAPLLVVIATFARR